MNHPAESNDHILIRGTMWLTGHQSRHCDHLDAEISIGSPYGHISSIRIHRPYDEDLNGWIEKVQELIGGGEVSVSATIVDGTLTTTLSGISRIVEPDDGSEDFDETSRTRVGLLDDLFETLSGLDRNPDDLPTRPGSCALIIATLGPFIERLGTVRCEASPVGGVIASIEGSNGTASVHAMPQGHLTVTGGESWNPSARHDVPSAQNALRTMLDLG